MWVKTDPPRVGWLLTIATLLVWWLVCWWGTGYADLGHQRAIHAGAFGISGSLLVLFAAAAVLYCRQRRAFLADLVEREQRVAHAHNFLDQIVNTIVDPLFVKDHEHRWVMVNHAFCKIHGQPRENFIGKLAHDVFAEAIAQGIWDADEKVLTAGIESITEEKLTDSQGVTHIVVTKKALHMDASGQRFIVGIISDITERKQVERLIRAKEQEFQSLAENLPVAVIRYDTDCRRRYLNRSAQRMLYASTTELLGLTPGGGGIPASPAMIKRYRVIMEEVLATDAAQELDFVLDALPTDQQKHYEVRFAPDHGVDGKTCGVLAIWYDITERKRMEDQLAQREQEFRSLAESSPDFVVRYDGDARFLYFNDRLLGHLGLASLDEVVGKRPGEVWPDGRFAELEQAVERAMAGEGQVNIDLVEPTPSGAFHHYQIFVVPESGARGQLVGAIAFGRDITAIREAEHRLAHFIDNLPGLVYTFHASPDGHGHFPFVSPAIEEIYGLKPEDVKDDMAQLHAMAHPDDQPRIEAAIAESARTMTPFRIESRVCRPGHPERWFDMRAVPEHQPDGSTLWYGLMLDITERKHLENALKQRETAFRALAENLPDPVFRYGRDCRRLYVNPAAMRVTAMTAAQLLGNIPTTCATVTPEDAANTMEAIREVVATGERRSFNIGYVNSDGSVSDYQGVLVPEFDASGQVATVLTMAHDITPLRKAERHAASFFSNMPGFAYTLRMSPDGRISLPFASSGIESIYGLRPEEVRDDISPLHALEHPEDLPRIKAASTGAAQTLQPFHVEFRIQRPGHSQRWIESRSMPERQTDGGVLWHGIMLDITERKRLEMELGQREREFRALAENSPDPIYRYDRNCRRLYVNPAIGKISGKPVAELIGKSPADGQLLVSEQSKKLMDAIRGVFDSGEVDQVGLEFTAPDGLHRDYHMLLVPERDAGGQVATVLGVAHDVTENRRIESSLRKSRDVVRALAAHRETVREKERRKLAYEIHEDLAQNFAALRLNLALLEMGGTVATQAPVLKTMHGIADRSIARIRDMVSTLRPAVLDFGLISTLQWLVDDFRGVGLAFDLSLQDNIALNDEAITFLYRAAKEALLNIALHAAATHVHVSLAANKGACRLAVRDNGCGFDSAAPRGEGRFGLIGLAEGALHLGGELFVDSTPGHGTTFEIRMPIPHFSST